MKIYCRVIMILSFIMIIINYLFIYDKYLSLFFCDLLLTFMALSEIAKTEE